MKSYFDANTFEEKRHEIIIEEGSPYRNSHRERPFVVGASICLPAEALEEADIDWITNNCGSSFLITMVNFVSPPVRVIEFEDSGDAVLFKLYAC